MKAWPVQDAKARFSELLRLTLSEGPQTVTLRGEDVAVIAPMREWRRLQKASTPTLKALLLSDEGRGAIPIPQRGRLKRRPVDLAD
jgi:antitoxin Phd